MKPIGMVMGLWLMIVPVAATAQTCDLLPSVTALAADCAEVARGEPCATDGGRVIHAQANLPTALPAHNLVIVTLGDATVANAAATDAPLLPGPPVTVTPTVNVNVRRAPSTEAERLGAVEAGAALFADALDPSGGWVRIAYRNRWGWVSRDYVAGVLDALPVIALEDDGAYAALTVEVRACGAVVLQPPRVTELRVRVNGATLWINNTVVLDADGDHLRVTAIDGGVRLADGVRVPRGFSVTRTGDGWQFPRPMSAAQMSRYGPLERLPVSLVNEAVTLPVGAYIRPGV